jgi:hypothetical protein
MVASADQQVHENTAHTYLSAVAHLLALKSQYNMSVAHFEANLDLISELLHPESMIPKDFYQSKKLMEGLGMPYVKIVDNSTHVSSCSLAAKFATLGSQIGFLFVIKLASLGSQFGFLFVEYLAFLGSQVCFCKTL